MTLENTKPYKTGFPEFVALMALAMSLVGLSIDAMLPALPEIVHYFEITRANSEQFVLSALFVGLAAGQLIAGPLADTLGRKKGVYIGLSIFIVGCMISYYATSFEVLLVGRLLQGLGAAGPRIVTIAIVRDRYEGRDMARVMSIIMACFILVPAIAPTIGQVVMGLMGWKSIFVVFAAIAMMIYIWISLRLVETLRLEDRRPFNLPTIASGIRTVCSNRKSLCYTISAGLMFGAFIGYLNSSQMIFQTHYGVGDKFPAYFAISALALGVASVTNAMFVKKYGMRNLVLRALIAMALIAGLFIGYEFWAQEGVPLISFIIFMGLSAFCMGLLFGNFNALAMEPMGHLAGTASAVVGCLSLVVAMSAGGIIGQLYDDTLFPVSIGFLILSLLALLMMWLAERGQMSDAINP